MRLQVRWWRQHPMSVSQLCLVVHVKAGSRNQPAESGGHRPSDDEAAVGSLARMSTDTTGWTWRS